MNQALGGWSLNGLFTARTGAPFTIFDCTNAAFEVCARLVPTGGLATSTPNDPQPSDSGANVFKLIDLSNQTPGNYAHPLLGNL